MPGPGGWIWTLKCLLQLWRFSYEEADGYLWSYLTMTWRAGVGRAVLTYGECCLTIAMSRCFLRMILSKVAAVNSVVSHVTNHTAASNSQYFISYKTKWTPLNVFSFLQNLVCLVAGNPSRASFIDRFCKNCVTLHIHSLFMSHAT